MNFLAVHLVIMLVQLVFVLLSMRAEHRMKRRFELWKIYVDELADREESKRAGEIDAG